MSLRIRHQNRNKANKELPGFDPIIISLNDELESIVGNFKSVVDLGDYINKLLVDCRTIILRYSSVNNCFSCRDMTVINDQDTTNIIISFTAMCKGLDYDLSYKFSIEDFIYS